MGKTRKDRSDYRDYDRFISKEEGKRGQPRKKSQDDYNQYRGSRANEILDEYEDEVD
jgi:hypothetical protein